MLPGYWQANAFPFRYWQDRGNYWPHFPPGDGVPLPPSVWPLKWWWIRERDLLNDDDEVLVIL